MVRGPQLIFAKILGLGTTFKMLTKVRPLGRGTVSVSGNDTSSTLTARLRDSPVRLERLPHQRHGVGLAKQGQNRDDAAEWSRSPGGQRGPGCSNGRLQIAYTTSTRRSPGRPLFAMT